MGSRSRVLRDQASEAWRPGGVAMKAWPWRRGHEGVALEAWPWRRGHEGVALEAWPWRPGGVAPEAWP
ncbi:hypothetical protein EYF80_045405 [Liparis tanakae]|uniref:Uncharacterized protein n=1 Tax=Liparis tanakae TaxID=230148 RepID=A0A4Z2FVQ2_9TELE|nr:hypothetical protein EYF80_045405 [Liparis tanakae]